MNKLTPPAPPQTDRRQLLLGVAFLATAGVAKALVPRVKIDLLGRRQLEKVIPTTIGPWSLVSRSGLVVPPTDSLKDQLYSQVLTRVYDAPGRPDIMLLIAQSPAQDGFLQLHRPEVCYPFGGYRLSEVRHHELDLGHGSKLRSNFFTATSVDRIEQLMYWTRIGHRNPESWFEQRLAVAAANIDGLIPDGILVRVSTISADTAALAHLDEFTKMMLAALAPSERKILYWD